MLEFAERLPAVEEPIEEMKPSRFELKRAELENAPGSYNQ